MHYVLGHYYSMPQACDSILRSCFADLYAVPTFEPGRSTSPEPELWLTNSSA